MLSRLLGDPVYESLARRAVRAIWERRHKFTGLVGEKEKEDVARGEGWVKGGGERRREVGRRRDWGGGGVMGVGRGQKGRRGDGKKG